MPQAPLTLFSQRTLLKKLKAVSPTVFENVIYDLLGKLGLQNCTWRTPGSDAGRDIEGSYSFVDISEYRQQQKWYVECKKYKGAVNWPTIWEKLSYAEAQGADVLLIASTATPSTQAVDQIEKWNRKRKGVILRFWAIHKLVTLLLSYPEILRRHQLIAATPLLNYRIIYPLTSACLKHTQAAEAHITFSGSNNPSLEAALALADLINKKIETNAADKILPIRKEDIYEWINVSDDKMLKGFDRYGWRALMASIRCMTKQSKIMLATTPKGFKINFVRSLTGGQNEELRQIVDWTGGECSVRRLAIHLNRRTK